MNRIVLTLSALLCGSAFAGPPDSKTVAPAPPELYGTGAYWALDMGANIYQDRGGDQTLTNGFGETLEISPKNDVGFFGGLKLGYVFGTGTVRPTVEADFFYNGFRGGADLTLTDAAGVVTRSSTSTSYINTGAFMGNGILRFAFGKFQPYFGAGVGIYYAESAGFDLTTPNGNTFSTGGGGSHSDLAWQVIAGADYYFNPRFSTFIEYKYLDYTSTQINTIQDRDLGQQLLGAGLRFHF
jgi:opacity protein-like surface antigen